MLGPRNCTMKSQTAEFSAKKHPCRSWRWSLTTHGYAMNSQQRSSQLRNILEGRWSLPVFHCTTTSQTAKFPIKEPRQRKSSLCRRPRIHKLSIAHHHVILEAFVGTDSALTQTASPLRAPATVDLPVGADVTVPEHLHEFARRRRRSLG